MKHFLNGVEITPRNRDEIGVVSNFTGDPNELSLSVDSIVLPREGYEIIQQHILTNGVFIGIPYTVEMDGGITLDYYVDLTEKPIIRQHDCEVTVKRRKGIDDFMEKARGTSFELMRSKGVQFNIRVLPYFVIKDNISETLLTMSVSLYVIGKELIQATQELVEAINDLIEASTPIPGLAPPGIPVVSFNVPAIVRASLNVLLRAAYLTAIVILITNLALQMFNILFPPKRFLKGVYFYDLMKKGCQFLGYDFQSSLISESKSWFCLPVPLKDDNDSIFEKIFAELVAPFNKGYPTASDTVGLFGNFIDEVKKIFNAELFILGNVVRLERRDYQANIAPQVVLPALSLQSERDDAYTFNTDEMWKRYYIKYALDFTDLHSVEGPIYEMHDAEYSTENSVAVSDPSLVTIKGLNEVQINFSLGANKTSLTALEFTGLVFFGLIDVITFVCTLGFAGTNYVQLITDRYGALKVSQQYWGITKAIYVKNAGIKKVQGTEYPQVLFDGDYRTVQSAANLWDKFHYIEAIDKNDFIIKENVRFRLRANEFVSLLNSNYALIDGKVCELLRIEWIDEKSNANISYKEPLDYANGKVNIIRVDQ
jgi:hypothetical protein